MQAEDSPDAATRRSWSALVESLRRIGPDM